MSTPQFGLAPVLQSVVALSRPSPDTSITRRFPSKALVKSPAPNWIASWIAVLPLKARVVAKIASAKASASATLSICVQPTC